MEYFFTLLKNQKIKFLGVGAYNTLVGLIVGNGLLLLTNDRYVIVMMVIIYVIGLIHNYFSFEKIVFRSNIGFKKGLIRLNNTYIITAVIRWILASILVYHFGVNDNMAYNIVFPITLTIKYFMHRKYTFSASFK